MLSAAPAYLLASKCLVKWCWLCWCWRSCSSDSNGSGITHHMRRVSCELQVTRSGQRVRSKSTGQACNSNVQATTDTDQRSDSSLLPRLLWRFDPEGIRNMNANALDSLTLCFRCSSRAQGRVAAFNTFALRKCNVVNPKRHKRWNSGVTSSQEGLKVTALGGALEPCPTACLFEPVNPVPQLV